VRFPATLGLGGGTRLLGCTATPGVFRHPGRISRSQHLAHLAVGLRALWGPAEQVRYHRRRRTKTATVGPHGRVTPGRAVAEGGTYGRRLGIMSSEKFGLWFRVVSAILVLFGVIYVFFGLKILPVDRATLLPWESALYGAIMTGWGLTLLLAGRLAFRRDDAELKRVLLLGLLTWLVVEAGASMYFGVWFNVGVDVAVFVLFAVPLIRSGKKERIR